MTDKEYEQRLIRIINKRITPDEWNSAGVIYYVGNREVFSDAVQKIMADRLQAGSDG